MTDQAAYRAHTARANAILNAVEGNPPDIATVLIAGAQVHAILALAAAQDRVQPAERPIDPQVCPQCGSANRRVHDAAIVCYAPWHDEP